MEYIMTAVGIILIIVFICILLVLCPIVFSFVIVAVDEFLKMCKWIKNRMKKRNYDEKNEVIVSKAEYCELLDIRDEYDALMEYMSKEMIPTDEEWEISTMYADEITDKDMTMTMDYDPALFEDIMTEEEYNPNKTETEITDVK